uniref:VP2 n=1 Tax=Seal parvovirus TaxID=1427158 RepID=A0A0A0R2R1_9VIRU|nr:VP2 [Seal parvovirus]
MEDGEGSGQTLGGGGGAPAGPTIWSNESAFEGGKVISTMSRQVIIPFDPQQRYKPFSLPSGTAGGEHSYAATLSHPIIGYETPWRYLDLNCAELWFSPSEWQRLLESSGGIRPKSMEIFISNIVIKDVAKTSNNETQVTDSASGALAIFTDETYDYPYVLGNGQDSLPSPLPFIPYMPPKYAYLTIGQKSGHTGVPHFVLPTEETSFYILEQSTYLTLKQGMSYSHKYSFPGNLPWKSFYGPGQNWLTMGNPLLDSRYFALTALGSQAQWRRIGKNEYGRMPQNWQPGPLTVTHVGEDGWHGGSDEGQAVFTGTSVGQTVSERWSLRPGPSSQAFSWEDKHNPDRDRNFKVSVDALALGTQHSGKVQWESARLPDDKHLLRTLQTPDHYTFSVKTSPKNNRFFSEQYPDDRALMPGSIWNERQWNLEDQIWAKIPETDHHFMTSTPAMGGWGMEKPPPQTFFKIIPQYAEISENDIGDPGVDTVLPLVHQYAQFTLSARFEWETQPRVNDARWNPQPPIQPPAGSRHIPYVPFENSYLMTKHGIFNGQVGYDKSARLWGCKGRVKNL